QCFDGEAQGYGAFGRVRGKEADRGQIVENSACGTLGQTGYARDLAALEFTPDQGFLQQRRGFRPELVAPFDIAAKPLCKRIELEEASHELHLIQCNLQKPLNEFGERTL